MKDAVLRLGLISLSALLMVFVAILGLNVMGSKQQFAAFEHPILDYEKPLLIYNPFDASIQSIDFDSDVTLIPYLYLTVKNDQWLLKQSKDDEGGLGLDDYLAQNKFFALAIFVSSRIHLGGLFKILNDRGWRENIIVFANEQKIQIELKKLAPRWLYVANPSQKMRLKVLDSFWLSSIASYDFDFLVINNPQQDLISSKLAQELAKRFKKLILKTDNIQFSELTGSQNLYWFEAGSL